MLTLYRPTVAQARAQIPELERRRALMPEHFEIVHSLGVMYFMAGRLDESLECLLRAHALGTGAPCELDIVACLRDLGRLEEANGWSEIGHLRHGEDPLDTRFKLARAESLLQTGDYVTAWPIYERARLTKCETQLQAGISSATPEWRGESIDTPLLVLGEGGWGDRICHSRFLPWINERGVRYQCWIDQGVGSGHTALGDMFKRVPWRDRTFDATRLQHDGKFAFSHWTTTFGLMAAFKVPIREVPAIAPWIPDAARVEKMQLIADDRPTVGLAWAAGEKPADGRKCRSMTEWQASRLVAQTDGQVRWINLQHDFEAPSGCINFPAFRCWDDTAAAMMQCDLIVTVDTAIMHLAAALGMPTWVVLSGNSDWKFGLSGQCPWYPKARLFRNGRSRGFENSLDELIGALRNNEAWEYRRVVGHGPVSAVTD